MENEFNVKKLIGVIKKRFWIILVTTILFSVLNLINNQFLTKPRYETSSKLIVNAGTPDLMNTLNVMMKEPSLLEHVVNRLDLNRSPEDLSEQITVENIGGSSIVKVTVVDSDPYLAAGIADTTAYMFKEEMPNILGFSDIKILSEAEINSNPINDDHLKKLLLGILVGFIVGIGIVFLLEFLDDTVRTEHSAELLLEVPVLGTISKMSKKNTMLSKSERLRIKAMEESYAINEKKASSINEQNQSNYFY